MEEYGKIPIIAIPVFLLLIIVEKVYGIYKIDGQVLLNDSASRISSSIVGYFVGSLPALVYFTALESGTKKPQLINSR